MATAENYTDSKFKISNDGERYTWAAYHLFAFSSSLIGDTLILIASFNKDTFKIHKFLVAIIQHIAAADLLVTIFDVFPGLISLCTNTWILGFNLCFAKVYVAYYVHPVSIYLIALLTTSKFLILRYPLRASSFSEKQSHHTCGLTWIFCLIMPALMFSLRANDVYFHYRSYNCGYQFKNEIWEKLTPVVAVIFSFAPNIVIISTTIPTLKYLARARKSARRVQGSLPWKGALTVALSAIVYILSNLPFVTTKIVGAFMKSKDTSALRWFYIDLYRFTTSLLYVNTMSNFYIYLLTIKSFREFFSWKSSSVAPVSLETIRSAASTTV